MSKVIAISNQKGGVGKSLTCHNLAVAKSMAGFKSLIIDMDPQASVTIMCGLDPYDDRFEKQNIVSAVAKKPIPISECIHPVDTFGTEIVRSNLDLSLSVLELVGRYAREQILKRQINTIRDRYDYIFIDCPPELGMLTINALCAADSVIIPVKAEYICYRGLDALLQTVDDIRDMDTGINPALRIEGAVVTMYEGRIRDQQEVMTLIRGKVNVLGSVKKTADAYRAVADGIPVVQAYPKSDAATAYAAISGLI